MAGLSFILLSVVVSVCRAAEFNYDLTDTSIGPSAWTGECQTGKSQTPIDIPTKDAIPTKFAKIAYANYDAAPSAMKIKNNGHTIQVDPEFASGKEATISGAGLNGVFKVAQFHFHWGQNNSVGSEHLLGGKAFPMELHFVHYNSTKYADIGAAVTGGGQGALGVLGVFFKIASADNPKLAPLITALASVLKADTQATVATAFPFTNLLPEDQQTFYRYEGGLTTPGCNEIVTWTVLNEPVPISAAQMAEFAKVLDDKDQPVVKFGNYRPIQDLNGRKVMVAATGDCCPYRTVADGKWTSASYPPNVNLGKAGTYKLDVAATMMNKEKSDPCYDSCLYSMEKDANPGTTYCFVKANEQENGVGVCKQSP